MEREKLMTTLIGLFCVNTEGVDFKGVLRINDLSEEDWETFKAYVRSNRKFQWLDPLVLMEVIDMLCDNMEKPDVD